MDSTGWTQSPHKPSTSHHLLFSILFPPSHLCSESRECSGYWRASTSLNVTPRAPCGLTPGPRVFQQPGLTPLRLPCELFLSFQNLFQLYPRGVLLHPFGVFTQISPPLQTHPDPSLKIIPPSRHPSLLSFSPKQFYHLTDNTFSLVCVWYF